MTVREYAESILLGTELADKLRPPPQGLTLDPPRRGEYSSPTLPGRAATLQPHRNGITRSKIPSAEQLLGEEQRAILLHFFCNHELLAVELMALALLKFPDAPDAFRKGLLHTLREEQDHTQRYLERMHSIGLKFGDLSLSSMIWDHIAPMESPLEYVSRLSLTFEQGNLDYAAHYSKAFAQVGDNESAELLAKIYKDEIAHVGYGLKWLRRFKQEKESDWDAWHRSLAFPLSPIRAKAPEATIPFNEAGRRKAGLKEDFIQELRAYQKSRGRSPEVYWFNPRCEDIVRQSVFPKIDSANSIPKAVSDLEQDLEALILCLAHADDLALLRKPPSSEHLISLRQAGLSIPEIQTLSSETISQLKGRSLRGFQPWAWSPDSSEITQACATAVTPRSESPWRPPLPPHLFSKSLVGQLASRIHLKDNPSLSFEIWPKETQAHQHQDKLASLVHQLTEQCYLLKAPFSCAGRHQEILDFKETPFDHEQIEKKLHEFTSKHGGVIIEPYYQRLLDFSALYYKRGNGKISLDGFTRQLIDKAGRYEGSQVAHKLANIFPPPFCQLFHQPNLTLAEEKISPLDFYRQHLPRTLASTFADYTGPLSVDAFFYQNTRNNEILIRPLVELNPRHSMGRVAHLLARQLSPNTGGTLKIIPRKQLSKQSSQSLILNDPKQARRFLAIWENS